MKWSKRNLGFAMVLAGLALLFFSGFFDVFLGDIFPAFGSQATGEEWILFCRVG